MAGSCGGGQKLISHDRTLSESCDLRTACPIGLRLHGSSGPAQPSSRSMETKANGAKQAELDELMNSLARTMRKELSRRVAERKPTCRGCQRTARAERGSLIRSPSARSRILGFFRKSPRAECDPEGHRKATSTYRYGIIGGPAYFA